MNLTPYDRGDRLVPIPWVQEDARRYGTRPDDDWGKVDFDNEESGTEAVAYIEKNRDEPGYTLRVANMGIEPLRVVVMEDDKLAPVIQPTEALRRNVEQIRAQLPKNGTEDESVVYYSENNHRAMVLLHGEKHVRKQLLLFVTDVGDGEVISAYVKDWANGVRDTRIG
jgi:hypothetical protein